MRPITLLRHENCLTRLASVGYTSRRQGAAAAYVARLLRGAVQWQLMWAWRDGVQSRPDDCSPLQVGPGDTLVVWRLDRLGRSMTHLVTLIQELLQRHVSFRSLSDGAIDTTTASGELVFHIFSALAQFERRLMQERTHAGLAVARARGKKGGRTPLRAEEPRVRMAYTMSVDQSLTVRDICRVLRISQATFYRYVALGRQAVETT